MTKKSPENLCICQREVPLILSPTRLPRFSNSCRQMGCWRPGLWLKTVTLDCMATTAASGILQVSVKSQDSVEGSVQAHPSLSTFNVSHLFFSGNHPTHGMHGLTRPSFLLRGDSSRQVERLQDNHHTISPCSAKSLSLPFNIHSWKEKAQSFSIPDSPAKRLSFFAKCYSMSCFCTSRASVCPVVKQELIWKSHCEGRCIFKNEMLQKMLQEMSEPRELKTNECTQSEWFIFCYEFIHRQPVFSIHCLWSKKGEQRRNNCCSDSLVSHSVSLVLE